jgi:hypothetical protein
MGYVPLPRVKIVKKCSSCGFRLELDFNGDCVVCGQKPEIKIPEGSAVTRPIPGSGTLRRG